jgi:hypothetical protein
MRKMLLAATAAVLFAAGAAHANSNVPSWSPYAIMPQAPAPAMGYPPEGRAAYIDNGPWHDYRRAAPRDAYPRDWGSVGLPVGSSGDYSHYF